MSAVGVVLSGGGARGAYEAGVLSYVFGDLARAHPISRLALVSGSSVGAINGAFLAAMAGDPAAGIASLEQTWANLELPHVLRFGVRQATELHRVLLGGNKASGLFDARPLARVVGQQIPWKLLRRNIRSGVLRAFIVSATDVSTGRPTIFVDRAPGVRVPGGLAPMARVRRERIGPHHVLASAAIPIIFPPVQVGPNLYCDGGLRLNTPMAPAIHLGVRKLFVVGVSSPIHSTHLPALGPGRFPGASFLLGKIMNAFLLDHLNSDLDELARINNYIEDGCAVYGKDFIERINQESAKRGEPARQIVRALAVRPTVDLGRVASEHLRRNRARFGRVLGRAFLRLLDVGEGADADLASYLLFDGDFARRLMDLGRADARALAPEILEFLTPAPSEASIIPDS
ncbi:MAG: patatin-like phospholipase family protein [Deltaproteobacteria bacterium]|nr:patatin-like phospholipase family protein [Deltaproteobacteria bacterium]